MKSIIIGHCHARHFGVAFAQGQMAPVAQTAGLKRTAVIQEV